MVKWLYCGMMYQKPPSPHYGEIVKRIWCKCADNKRVECWNGEAVIITFARRLFLAPLRQWGPIPLLPFVVCCIPHLFMSCLWTVLRWLSKRPTRPSNALGYCIHPLILPNGILLFLPTINANNGGGLSPLVTSCMSKFLTVPCSGNLL